MRALKTLAQSIKRCRRSKVLPSGSPNAMTSSFLPFAIHAKNLVNRLVADVEESRRIPHRPLGEAEAGGNGFQFRVAADEFQELRRKRLKLESPWFSGRKDSSPDYTTVTNGSRIVCRSFIQYRPLSCGELSPCSHSDWQSSNS